MTPTARTRYMEAGQLREEGLSYTEIAQRLGVSYRWAMSLVKRYQEVASANAIAAQLGWNTDMPIRVRNALRRAQVYRPEQIATLSDDEVLALVRNLGPKGLDLLRACHPVVSTNDR